MFYPRIWRRSFVSGPAAMLVLLLFQVSFVLLALLQSTYVCYRVYTIGSDQARYYHTIREPIGLQLLGMLAVLILAELLVSWCFTKLAVAATPVIVPLFILLTLSVVYQTYARSPRNSLKHFGTILMGLGAMLLSMAALHLFSRIRQSGHSFRCMLYACWLLCLLNLLVGFISGTGAFLHLGILNLQPGEFFKLFTVFLIGAGFSQTLQDSLTSHLLLFTLLFQVLTLVLVRDLGNAFILFVASLLVILFRYGARAAGALAAAAALGSVIGYRILSAFLPEDSRVLWRISNTFEALTVPLEGRVNRDLRTALFAALRGGVFGTGVANNTYILNNAYIYTDFVFDMTISFFGVATALLAVLCIILLAFRSRTTLKNAGQNLSFYVYSNLMILVLTVQAAIHVGGNLNILPFTGVTFPFLSAGGSSMIASFLELGLALGGRVSNDGLSRLQAPVEQYAAKLDQLLEPVCAPMDRWVLHHLARAESRLPGLGQFFHHHRQKGGSYYVSSE